MSKNSLSYDERAAWRWLRKQVFAELGIRRPVGRPRALHPFRQGLIREELSRVRPGGLGRFARYLAQVNRVNLSTIRRAWQREPKQPARACRGRGDLVKIRCSPAA